MSETVVEADYFFHGGVFSGHILVLAKESNYLISNAAIFSWDKEKRPNIASYVRTF